MQRIDAVLGDDPEAAIAVLVADEPSAVVAAVRAGFRAPRLTTVPVRAQNPTMHVRLASGGRYRLIADGGTGVADPAALFRSVLLHLSPGGKFLDAGFRPELPAPAGLGPLLHRLGALQQDRGQTPPPGGGDEQGLARAVRRVHVDGNRLVVTNGIQALAKLRDADIDHVLAERGADFGIVFDRIDAESFLPRSIIRDHHAESTVRELKPIPVPRLSLRQYNDAICALRQVMFKDNVVLPDTYRHHLQRRLVNRGLDDLSEQFALVPRGARRATELSGTYFAWDSEHPGHFGHTMTEQLSRLWAWDAAKARFPDLRPLLSRYHLTSPLTPAESGILAAAGLDPAEAELFARPVRVERLVAATPMFSMPHYVSPRIGPLWTRISAAAAARATGDPSPARVFISRKSKNRWCNNRAAVEEFFERYGFTVVFPEELPFPDQVAVFRNADVVAGFAGSAMFHLAFCDEPKPVLLLSSEMYEPRNEYLIAAVHGHEVDVFWSVPDRKEFTSSFFFDFDREGRHLRRRLDELTY